MYLLNTYVYIFEYLFRNVLLLTSDLSSRAESNLRILFISFLMCAHSSILSVCSEMLVRHSIPAAGGARIFQHHIRRGVFRP